jgi:hypothetical protein
LLLVGEDRVGATLDQLATLIAADELIEGTDDGG